jgi:hypothetical protein
MDAAFEAWFRANIGSNRPTDYLRKVARLAWDAAKRDGTAFRGVLVAGKPFTRPTLDPAKDFGELERRVAASLGAEILLPTEGD